MKVLLSERTLDGHRKTYMEWLAQIRGIEFYVLAPENPGIDGVRFTEMRQAGGLKSLKAYLKWVRQMREIVRRNQVDVVHILDGDSIMRWFGIGLGSIPAKQIIITYHHFFPGKLRKLSYRMMCRGTSRLCVAHTESVEHGIRHYGVKRVKLCEYPAFHFERIAKLDSVVCKTNWKLPTEIPVIGIIGGMCTYKNIIPFLETLQGCTSDFHLLICGDSGGISESEIRAAADAYRGRTTIKIRHLSEKEYEDAIGASDIIFCIYGHDFDGASGPLTDGVCAKKMILSCRHGSLGEIVTNHSLGLTAESSDREDMLRKTEKALSMVHEFTYNEEALRYRDGLRPLRFQEKYESIYRGCMVN